MPHTWPSPRPRPAATPRAGRGPGNARPALVRRAATTLTTVLAALSVVAVGAALDGSPATDRGAVRIVAARTDPANPVTPGDFTGYAFDQCFTPSQTAMDTWLATSPFLAVGIYISGDSRACRSQPNLTPAWVRTQLANGWRLLPITMGPQASCQPRFPRYDDDFKISPQAGGRGNYSKARTMGKSSATQSVTDATALGIVPGSTLWYDLEGYNSADTVCRDSALAFLSGWTKQIHRLGYVSGVYSSAGSGIADLDDARVERPSTFTMPDRVWMARWDGVANTSTSYVRGDGWRPGGRVKQYQGGHDETWGGTTINIDRDYLDLGRGSVATPEDHCGGTRVNFPDYQPLHAAAKDATPSPSTQVMALQCLLQERGSYDGKISGVYSDAVVAAAQGWQQKRGFPVDSHGRWFRRDWMSLLASGYRPVQKVGSAGAYTARVQRALNASHHSYDLKVSGVFDSPTAAAVRDYQDTIGTTLSGVVDAGTWTALQAGKR